MNIHDWHDLIQIGDILIVPILLAFMFFLKASFASKKAHEELEDRVYELDTALRQTASKADMGEIQVRLTHLNGQIDLAIQLSKSNERALSDAVNRLEHAVQRIETYLLHDREQRA